MPRTEPGTFRGSKPNKELVEALATPPKQRCIIGQIIEEHPNGSEVAAALNNERWTATNLASVISSHIQPMRKETVSRHRNHTCVCER